MAWRWSINASMTGWLETRKSPLIVTFTLHLYYNIVSKLFLCHYITTSELTLLVMTLQQGKCISSVNMIKHTMDLLFLSSWHYNQHVHIFWYDMTWTDITWFQFVVMTAALVTFCHHDIRTSDIRASSLSLTMCRDVSGDQVKKVNQIVEITTSGLDWLNWLAICLLRLSCH